MLTNNHFNLLSFSHDLHLVLFCSTNILFKDKSTLIDVQNSLTLLYNMFPVMRKEEMDRDPLKEFTLIEGTKGDFLFNFKMAAST